MPISERWTCVPNSGPCNRSGGFLRPLLQPTWGTCATIHASCICTENAALARRVFVQGNEATVEAKKAFQLTSKSWLDVLVAHV